MTDDEKLKAAFKKQQADNEHKTKMRAATFIVDENFTPPKYRVPITPPDAMTPEEYWARLHPLCAALIYMIENVCPTEADRREKLELAVATGVATRKIRRDGSIRYRVPYFFLKPSRQKKSSRRRKTKPKPEDNDRG